jgi:hypothetical protein
LKKHSSDSISNAKADAGFAWRLQKGAKFFTAAANAAPILAMLQNDGVQLGESRLFLDSLRIRHVIVDEETGECIMRFLV